MSKGKKNGSRKVLKVVCITLAVLAVVFAGLEVFSRLAYHRSGIATIAEWVIRLGGSKSKFTDPDQCAEYIIQRGQAEPYTMNIKLKSSVSEEKINGSTVYTLTPSEQPQYIVLYLHGGAYVNDASNMYFNFCDKMARNVNAQVIFPIYPLAPNHTWEETFAILTEIYQSRLDEADVPVIVMGDSAGGGLSVAFCEYLAEMGLHQPDKLILFSPWMDVSMSNAEAEKYEDADPMLSAYGLVEMGKRWAGELDLQDYRISPIFGDISALQNVSLFVGTREIFYPDVTAFYNMLQEQAISCKLFVGEGMNHVYPFYPIPEAGEAVRQVYQIIRDQD
ncbi:MAG: alpha/beta hydrolase [Clostridia bacterium]|nr:alpha/beta hydrolase [Clostridia bacterium]